MLYGSVTDSSVKDVELIVGGQHPFFFDHFSTNSDTVINENLTAPHVYSLIFNQSNFADSGDAPTFDYKVSQGPIFMNSELGSDVEITLVESNVAKFAMKLMSNSQSWSDPSAVSIVGDSDPNTDPPRLPELEICGSVACPAPPQCRLAFPPNCYNEDTNDLRCFDTTTTIWLQCSANHSVVSDTCDCRPNSSCPDSLTFSCQP